jgi:hypothetical protein
VILFSLPWRNGRGKRTYRSSLKKSLPSGERSSANIGTERSAYLDDA